MTKRRLIYIILRCKCERTLRGDFMKIDLTNLYNGSESERDINYSLDMRDLLYGTYFPIKEPVDISGRVYTKADVIYLNLKIEYTINGFCDRCADEVKVGYSIDIDKIIVQELQNEDDDNYIIVDSQTLNLDELVYEEVSLSLPSKLLCSEDCKGLCQKCGTNLNVNKCDCKSDIDPRMEALLQLLNEE